jgi:hypothetical protein
MKKIKRHRPEANSQIQFLNIIGNNIAAFEYAHDSKYVVIAYIEKL